MDFQSPLFLLEGYCKLAFLLLSFFYIPVWWYKYLVLGLAMFVCYLGLNRQVGKL